jgi:NAD(P)H-hydrate repair Nnr-like enzyme with NAD(P)H-hydrate epimerase domain
LIEHGGRTIASFILQFLGQLKDVAQDGKVVLLAGGDVRGSMCVAAARVLAGLDIKCTVVVLEPTEDMKHQLASANVGTLFYDFPRDLEEPDLIVDALLPPAWAASTLPNQFMPLTGDFKKAFAWLKTKTPKICIDIPSGYCPDSGRAYVADPVKPSYILSAGLPKTGILGLDKTRHYLLYCGVSKVAMGALFPGIESKWRSPFGDKFIVPLEVAPR